MIRLGNFLTVVVTIPVLLMMFVIWRSGDATRPK